MKIQISPLMVPFGLVWFLFLFLFVFFHQAFKKTLPEESLRCSSKRARNKIQMTYRDKTGLFRVRGEGRVGMSWKSEHRGGGKKG